MQEQLDRIEAKLDASAEKFHNHVVDDEKRFGRITYLLVALLMAGLSPKLGGPSLDQLSQAALHLLG